MAVKMSLYLSSPIKLFILIINHISSNPHRWVCPYHSGLGGQRLFGVFDMRIRFRNHSLIGLRQQMKAGEDSFEVFQYIIKDRSHCAISCQAASSSTWQHTCCASSSQKAIKGQEFFALLNLWLLNEPRLATLFYSSNVCTMEKTLNYDLESIFSSSDQISNLCP